MRPGGTGTAPGGRTGVSSGLTWAVQTWGERLTVNQLIIHCEDEGRPTPILQSGTRGLQRSRSEVPGWSRRGLPLLLLCVTGRAPEPAPQRQRDPAGGSQGSFQIFPSLCGVLPRPRRQRVLSTSAPPQMLLQRPRQGPLGAHCRATRHPRDGSGKQMPEKRLTVEIPVSSRECGHALLAV